MDYWQINPETGALIGAPEVAMSLTARELTHGAPTDARYERLLE